MPWHSLPTCAITALSWYLRQGSRRVVTQLVAVSG